MAHQSSRRNFLKAGTLAGAGYWVAARPAFGQTNSPNEKLGIAGIGGGGKGDSDIDDMAKCGCEVVAICDVTEGHAAAALKRSPKAKFFKDYREMLDKMDKDIDLCTISTPDHMHAVQTLNAMKRGKHVYTQKPLCHNVYEARMLTEAAKKTGVVTQMGNQGSAQNGLREAVEVIQSGGIGLVKEVHVWTNRAGTVWPQGTRALLNHRGARHALTGEELNIKNPMSDEEWKLWLGVAPYRPYDPCYAPFRWRGWLDFGTGALGDMACHTANMAFRACDLRYPTSVEAEMSEFNEQTWPLWSVIRYDFPERAMEVPGHGTVKLPKLKWTWYDGGADKPAWVDKKIKELAQGENVPDSGSLIIGEKGTLYSPNDYGAEYVLLPKADFVDFKKPTPWIPRADNKHQVEFVQAIKDNKPENCFSRFEVAGPLTETVVLGCVAMRAGKKIEWDGPNMKITNIPEANKFLTREYTKGFELPVI